MKTLLAITVYINFQKAIIIKMRDISEIHNLGNTYERILLVTNTNNK